MNAKFASSVASSAAAGESRGHYCRRSVPCAGMWESTSIAVAIAIVHAHISETWCASGCEWLLDRLLMLLMLLLLLWLEMEMEMA